MAERDNEAVGSLADSAAVKPDWSRGVRNKAEQTPDGLKQAAKIALDRASEWVRTAEQLLAKAADIKQGV